MLDTIRRSAPLAAAVLTSVVLAADQRGATGSDRSDESLHAALAEIVAANPARASLSTIGRSLGDRSIEVLTLSSDPRSADDRPGILVVAGLDGTRSATTEVALRMAAPLLASSPSMLDAVTVYIVPRANPDAAASFRSLPGPRGALGGRVVDEDRDGRGDEDGPADLDGNGVITLMRKIDPPPSLAVPTLVADEKDPRILREPQANKGETARYAVWVEGLDADGDGLIAEDGAGGVDPDLNFPAQWPEFDRKAGEAPLVEPESAALARFVAGHPRLIAVVTLGRHDNLVNVPDAKSRDATGRMPRFLDEADSAAWGELAKSYREITGLNKSTGADVGGSFHIWCGLHRGLASFATTTWTRPDAPAARPPESAPAPEPAGGGAAPAPAAERAAPASVHSEAGIAAPMQPCEDDEHDEHAEHSGVGIASPQSGPAPATPPTAPRAPGASSAPGGPPGSTGPGGPGGGRRGGRGGGGRGAIPAGASAPTAGETGAIDPEALGWLEYSDREREGSGFVPWTPFKHPTLGEVEIGGFVPGFRENPPPSAWDEIAAKQAKWIEFIASRRPSLAIRGPEVTRLADGLVRIDLAITNSGGLPLSMATGRGEGMAPPLVLRLGAPIERIKSGVRVATVPALAPGATHTASWIVEDRPGEAIDAVVRHPALGEWTVSIKDGAASAPVAAPGRFEPDLPIGHDGDGTERRDSGAAAASTRSMEDPAWNRFYDMDEVSEMLRRFASAHPELARLSTIGSSVEGRPIWLLTVTNFATGEADQKPAMYVDGSIHANEIQATETVLYSIWYMLKHHGSVPAVTQLLDRAAFYFVPVVNPDNRAGWFDEPATPSSHRTGRQPTDNDGDGLDDEDPPNDLDGDGSIEQMWRKDPFGTHRRNPRDPRILEAVPTEPRPDGTREYGDWSRAGEEGVDDDGDGRVNEDGPGGYDMNRNWPSGWQPNSVQFGAGPWPLFYPETRSIALFVLAHPNIAAGQAFHNAGGMILRGPGAPEREVDYPARDRAVYESIARAGEELLPFYRVLVIHSGLYVVHGGLVNWLAEGLGIVSFTNELWTDKRLLQSETDLTPEQRRRLDDRLLLGRTWSDWKELEHPQFGTVIVGGGNRWSSRIPPGFMLEEECHRNFAFVLHHADQMPLLRWESVTTAPLGGDLWEVTIAIANDRLIPTRTQRAAERRIGEPDRLVIDGGADVRVIAAGILGSRHDRTFAAQAHRPDVVVVEEGVPGHGTRLIRAIVRGKKGASIGLRYDAEKARDLDRTITLGDG